MLATVKQYYHIPKMDILTLPFEILLQVFESGNAATLLNLELVCKAFYKLIATYETSICSNLARNYSWAAEYGLGAPVVGTRTIKQVLWCAQLDVLFELAAHFHGTSRSRSCSHLFSLNSRAELAKRLEHGLAVYQRCADMAEETHSTELQRRYPGRVYWLSALPNAEAVSQEIYKEYIERLSQIDLFDYELLYGVSIRHARVRLKCCPPCRTKIRGSNIEASLAAKKPKTASILGLALKRPRSIDPVFLWIKRCPKLARELFASFRRETYINGDTSVVDEARPSVTWEDYRAMPLAIRIAALPVTLRNDSELPAVMHRYIERLRPTEARKAYLIFQVANRWTWGSPREIHESINYDLGNGYCQRELISR